MHQDDVALLRTGAIDAIQRCVGILKRTVARRRAREIDVHHADVLPFDVGQVLAAGALNLRRRDVGVAINLLTHAIGQRVDPRSRPRPGASRSPDDLEHRVRAEDVVILHAEVKRQIVGDVTANAALGAEVAHVVAVHLVAAAVHPRVEVKDARRHFEVDDAQRDVGRDERPHRQEVLKVADRPGINDDVARLLVLERDVDVHPEVNLLAEAFKADAELIEVVVEIRLLAVVPAGDAIDAGVAGQQAWSHPAEAAADVHAELAFVRDAELAVHEADRVDEIDRQAPAERGLRGFHAVAASLMPEPQRRGAVIHAAARGVLEGQIVGDALRAGRAAREHCQQCRNETYLASMPIAVETTRHDRLLMPLASARPRLGRSFRPYDPYNPQSRCSLWVCIGLLSGHQQSKSLKTGCLGRKFRRRRRFESGLPKTGALSYSPRGASPAERPERSGRIRFRWNQIARPSWPAFKILNRQGRQGSPRKCGEESNHNDTTGTTEEKKKSVEPPINADERR